MPERAASSGKSSSGSSGKAATAATATTRRGSTSGLITSAMGDSASQPGALAVLLGAVFAVVTAVYLLAIYKVDIDDRGEAVPLAGSKGFRGLFIATREALTGDRVVPEKVLAIDGVGPVWLVLVAIPVIVALGAFVMFRWRRRESMYWPVTIAMLLTAGTVLLLALWYFIPTMVALTVASFQIRKAELPGQMARREAARAEAEVRAAAAADDDEDEYEDDDEEIDDAYEDDVYEDEEDDDDAEDESGDDVEDVYEDDDTADAVEAELDAEDDAIVIVEAEAAEPEVGAEADDADEGDDDLLSELEDDIARDEAADADEDEDDTEGKPSTR